MFYPGRRFVNRWINDSIFLNLYFFSGDERLVGLTENKRKFRRWQVRSPEVARIVEEFEYAIILRGNKYTEFHHHEKSDSFQKKFDSNVKKLVAEFEQLGNPFLEDGRKELYQLGIKDIMSHDVVCAVKSLYSEGKKQFQEFRDSTVINWTVTLETPIKNNIFSVFKAAYKKRQSWKRATNELKMHVRLFSQMYIATQIRGGDMNEILATKH